MNILITGSAGLYGRHLVNLLSKQDNIEKIIGIDNLSRRFFEEPWRTAPKYEMFDQKYQEITPQFIDQNEINVIVHLAASVSIPESMDEPKKYFENNERGTFDLTQTLLKTKSQPALVYASSPEVYGNPLYVPMDESHTLKPKSVYAVTKLAAEKHCMSLWEWYKYPVVTIRNFNTYGENQNVWGYSAVIPAFIESALKNNPLKIEGDGNQTRDFMYVGDAINAYLSVINNLHKSQGKIFNIGTGQHTSIIDLAQEIISLTKSKSKISYVKARLGDIPDFNANTNYIRKNLHWKPSITLDEGLKKTINWYRKFL
jgi:nucleoside-diphosphate-sugar epimerase